MIGGEADDPRRQPLLSASQLASSSQAGRPSASAPEAGTGMYSCSSSLNSISGGVPPGQRTGVDRRTLGGGATSDGAYWMHELSAPPATQRVHMCMPFPHRGHTPHTAAAHLTQRWRPSAAPRVRPQATLRSTRPIPGTRSSLGSPTRSPRTACSADGRSTCCGGRTTAAIVGGSSARIARRTAC
eukprot:3122081-Prymnesium_polylepis.1